MKTGRLPAVSGRGAIRREGADTCRAAAKGAAGRVIGYEYTRGRADRLLAEEVDQRLERAKVPGEIRALMGAELHVHRGADAIFHGPIGERAGIVAADVNRRIWIAGGGTQHACQPFGSGLPGGAARKDAEGGRM